MIHVDARTPDQFYDERYDSYICFLMRGSRRSLATRTEVFQSRVGGEGALTGKRGFRSWRLIWAVKYVHFFPPIIKKKIGGGGGGCCV